MSGGNPPRKSETRKVRLEERDPFRGRCPSSRGKPAPVPFSSGKRRAERQRLLYGRGLLPEVSGALSGLVAGEVLRVAAHDDVGGGFVDGERAPAEEEAVPLRHRGRAPDALVGVGLVGARGVRHRPPADEVLDHRGEVGAELVEDVSREGVSHRLEDGVPDREHEGEVPLLHLREVDEREAGVGHLHAVRDRGGEEPRELVGGLGVEAPRVPPSDDPGDGDEGAKMAPGNHPCEARREGLDDARALGDRLQLGRAELREDRVEPEVATRVLAQGEVLEVGEPWEALVAEGLEVVGGAHPEARSGLEAVRGHDRGVELARAVHVEPAEDRQERPGDADERRRCHRVEGGVELGLEVGEVGGDVAGYVVDQDSGRVLEVALGAIRTYWRSPRESGGP